MRSEFNDQAFSPGSRKMRSPSRRALLASTATAAVGFASSQLFPRSAGAEATSCSYSMDVPPKAVPSLDSRLVNTSLVRNSFQTPAGTYFTYPHANGFLDDGTAIIASRDDKGTISYSTLDLASGSMAKVAEVRGARTYYAVSPASKTMVVPLNDGAVVVDLATGRSRRIASFPGWRVLGDIDIHPSGDRALIARWDLTNQKHTRIDIIDLRDGRISNVYDTVDLSLDHAHFSPYDPNWIQFSDGSRHSLHRIWVWHEKLAPVARSIFQQRPSNAVRYDIGHERAMFSEPAALVVCFAGSKNCKTGLYKVDYRDGSSYLISESNRDSHCNVSHSGRWAVVSEFLDAKVDEGNHRVSFCDPTPVDWIAHPASFVDGSGAMHRYVDSDVSIVNMRTGKREFLLRGSNALSETGSLQPWEVQPSISPGGNWILCKDGKNQNVFVLELNVSSLQKFST